MWYTSGMPHDWPLETRVCKCGCGKTFKCLPSSTAHYASIKHRNLTEKEEKEYRAGIKYGLDEDESVTNAYELGLLD